MKNITLTSASICLIGSLLMAGPAARAASDVTPPQVQILNPGSGASVSGAVPFSVDAYDEGGIKKVKFDLDGQLQAESYSEPFTWMWDTTAVADGAHTLTARVYDNAYNRTDVEVLVTVNNTVVAADTTPPQASFVNPADGSVVSGNAVEVAVNASDDVGIAKVKFDLDGVAQSEVVVAPYTWVWDTTTVTDGDHTLTARVYDEAYNRTDVQVLVTVSNSTRAATPATTLGIASPEAGAIVSGADVLVALASPDATTVNKVKFDVDGVLQAEDYSDPFEWSWNTTQVADGSHLLRTRVYNSDGTRTDLEIAVYVANDSATTTNPQVPGWAEQAYGALQAYKHLVDYWVGRRAADTSSTYFDVGGGWNDDVELAQSLAAYWLLTGDKALAAMFEDIADSIQAAPYIGSKTEPWTQPGDHRVEQGYGTVMLDVDHSAEETTLTFPRLFYVDYGDPGTIELMTRLIWNFEDNTANEFPGEDNWGEWVSSGMLMRSPRYNARNVDWCWVIPEPDKCFEPQDTVNSFRATAPGLSLAWYYGPGHYFWQEGSKGFMNAHHAAWVDASFRTNDGKPALVPPSKILLSTLGFGDWTNNDAEPSGGDSGWVAGAWVFRHFYHAMIGDSVIYKDQLDANLKALGTEASAIVQKAYSDRQNGVNVPVVNTSFSLDRQFLQWRAESGYSQDDDTFLASRASKNADTRIMAQLIYLERGELGNALTQATEGYRYLNDYLTAKRDEWTSALTAGSTGLTDNVKFEFADAFVMAALGGSGVYDGAYPTMYYSLNDTGAQVVTLVKDRSPTDTAFWVYNFGPEREIGIKLWRLAEGAGQLTIGPDANSDGVMDQAGQTIDLPKMRRGDEVRVTLPSGSLQLVRIQVTNPVQRNLAQLADPAVGHKDYQNTNAVASVTVHNVGLKATGSVVVRLYDLAGNPLGNDQIVNLPAYTGMDPVTQTVTWQRVEAALVGWVVIDPAESLEEITEHNNVLVVNGVGAAPVSF